MRAADPPGNSSLLAPPAANAPSDGGKVSTIRIDRRTGKLIRVVSGTPTAGPQSPGLRAAGPIAIPAPPAHISELVEQSSRAHQVDPLLVHSVIQVESNYNPYAVSNKGAEGLMQLMPSTSRMLGVANSFDPVENIEAGVKYLKYLQSVYHDDRLALAAYNAGPSAVTKFNEVPPYPETQNYVERVGERYRAAREALGTQDKDKSVAEDAQEAGTEANPPEHVEAHPKLEQFIDSDGRLHLTTAPQ
ncbi:MAG TPA: lytic transglycosylase domain-containing protein [Bryobacteraceae bacterium]|nr:lytic transglycosylase domain-containing protein [Bryobacteraceae bacterium]